MRQHWRNGVRHGSQETWNPKGIRMGRCQWNADKKSGICHSWHTNGKISGGNSTVVTDPDSGVNNNNNTAECGNGVIETGEDCDGTALGGQDCEDLNLGTGDLICTNGCTFDTHGCSEQSVCGNDEVEYGESCDGADLGGETCASQGLGTGALGCTTLCIYDTSGCAWCGSGTVDSGEQCDGVNLGGSDCTDLGYVGGTLICTGACTYDDSGCSNCETPDNTEPAASNHVPAPETQGASQATPISVDLFDGCGVDTTSVTMRLTITPKSGPVEVISVAPTVTGTGINVTATYNPGGFSPGTIVEVLLTAADINANTLTETSRNTLNEKSGAIRELNVKVEAGEAEAPPSADYILAKTEVPLAVRAVREMIKRLHRGDMNIRNAYGVGMVMDTSNDKSLLHAISLVNAGAVLYPEVAAGFPEELMQASMAHEATLLQAVAAGLPVSQQPNPDVARRKAVQVEVQDLVDKVIAAVAVKCWRAPEVLAVFKSALPSTSPPKK